MNKLSREDFIEVVKNAPLVAFDLVIHSTRGRFLLGLRSNEPAKDTWYFLGGRVFKDERINAAFHRVCEAELGRQFRQDIRFLGIWDYFFPTNFAGEPGFGTHYVSLTYEIIVQEADLAVFTEPQHSERRWFALGEILGGPQVHPNVQTIVTRLLMDRDKTGSLPIDGGSTASVDKTDSKL